MITRAATALVFLLISTPAWAAEATSVPEGSHFTLFGLGVLGLIVGRRAALSAQRRQRARNAKTK